MNCDCKDWKPNVKIIDGIIALHALRIGTKGYSGKPFVYCPWCGEKLNEETT